MSVEFKREREGEGEKKERNQHNTSTKNHLIFMKLFHLYFLHIIYTYVYLHAYIRSGLIKNVFCCASVVVVVMMITIFTILIIYATIITKKKLKEEKILNLITKTKTKQKTH